MENTVENGGYKTAPQIPAVKPKAKDKKNNGCLWWGIGILVMIFIAGCAIMILGIIISFASSGAAGSMPNLSQTHNFTEEFSSGSYFSSNKIAVISISGVITNADGGFSSSFANSQFISAQIKTAAADKNVKAVILLLNTPGGEVTAADTIYHELMKLRKETGKPVIAYMGSVAASGGVYIAVASDYIVANKLTTTGSIGVIAQTYNYVELFNKVGLKAETYTSGPMKDLLNGARPRTEEEVKIIQDIIDEVYDDFVKIVATGRPKLTVEKIRDTDIGDGRILTGRQALDCGLVDSLGYFEDAVNKALQLGSIPENDYKVVNYKRKLGFADLLFMEAKDKKIKVELPGAPLETKLPETGKFFFLPTVW